MTSDQPGNQPGAQQGALVLPSYSRDDTASHPLLASPAYRSTVKRAPARPPVVLPQMLTEVTGPMFGHDWIGPTDADLTRQHVDAPQGQRIIVYGRVLDSDGRPVPDTLLEIWQANAAGRYRHGRDNWPAPLDPNFTGAGRTITDADGAYEFVSIKPGAYPWGNHHNAWRPAHIHFSVFGRAFTQRLVTQMYFPDDPLFGQDPVYHSVPEHARERMISEFVLDRTEPQWALAFRFNLVLRGAQATPFEDEDDDHE